MIVLVLLVSIVFAQIALIDYSKIENYIQNKLPNNQIKVIGESTDYQSTNHKHITTTVMIDGKEYKHFMSIKNYQANIENAK